MAANIKKPYSAEDFEAKYLEITNLYDMAEELVNTVESQLVSDANAQLEIVEPLIGEIGDAADVLAQQFIYIAESKKNKTPMKASKKVIEGALRKMFAAINDYNGRVKNISKRAHGSIMNIADPIVQKIQRQVELVMVIFLEFVQLSLQSIMGKAELEALKVRDSRIALMMHDHALGQQS
ncbi:MAG: hypothetical protein EBV03_04045 [Proteobacteria bacterium]|nr:hypothetical protein [Pseudomonadota bacterium]